MIQNVRLFLVEKHTEEFELRYVDSSLGGFKYVVEQINGNELLMRTLCQTKFNSVKIEIPDGKILPFRAVEKKGLLYFGNVRFQEQTKPTMIEENEDV